MTEVEICILCGGRSRRMGRDKSRLRLGRFSLLGHVRRAALATGWPVRVIRTDPVPNCGPLGGMLGALQSTRAGKILFLACDMPLITPGVIRKLTERMRTGQAGVFTIQEGRHGFPCLLRREAVLEIGRMIGEGRRSLQELARELGAGSFIVSRREAPLLRNVNTPDDLAALKRELGFNPGRTSNS